MPSIAPKPAFAVRASRGRARSMKNARPGPIRRIILAAGMMIAPGCAAPGQYANRQTQETLNRNQPVRQVDQTNRNLQEDTGQRYRPRRLGLLGNVGPGVAVGASAVGFGASTGASAVVETLIGDMNLPVTAAFAENAFGIPAQIAESVWGEGRDLRAVRAQQAQGQQGQPGAPATTRAVPIRLPAEDNGAAIAKIEDALSKVVDLIVQEDARQAAIEEAQRQKYEAAQEKSQAAIDAALQEQAAQRTQYEQGRAIRTDNRTKLEKLINKLQD